MPYIPFPGFFPPRRVSHLCSAIIVAVKFWSTALQHQRFLVSCDNEGAVTVINSGSIKDPFMLRCLRQLWFTSALHDVDLRVRHIPGEHNTLADALSRWDNTSSQTLPKRPQLSVSVTFSKRYPETSFILTLTDIFSLLL